MAIYTNEHLTDLLNNEYEKVRKLEQENQRLKSNFAGYENFQREKQLEQDLQKTREQLIGVTEQLKARNEKYFHALNSIYLNTCCEPCQEAKLVAKEALGK